jgi:DNA-binding transcriptional regulator YdaS (Cro superfamily)
MGLWDVDDHGTVANRACWAMFAVTSGECCCVPLAKDITASYVADRSVYFSVRRPPCF